MNPNGPTLFYMPRLNDQELRHAAGLAFMAYDHAPRLCGALADAFMAEQTRRLRSDAGDPVETELLVLPFHRWPSRDLQQALSVVTVLSYSTPDHAVGQLVDSLVRALTAAVGARLLRLEEETCQR
jgi:hypothetical protein